MYISSTYVLLPVKQPSFQKDAPHFGAILHPTTQTASLFSLGLAGPISIQYATDLLITQPNTDTVTRRVALIVLQVNLPSIKHYTT